jgi:putative ABC transport system substrate-binding protein
MVTGGGLMSYAPNLVDQLRRAAGYVDRILKGEITDADQIRAGINLKTAKALGLTVPPGLLVAADEVIE